MLATLLSASVSEDEEVELHSDEESFLPQLAPKLGHYRLG